MNGDHFVVLLPYDKKQDLTAYCDALLRALNGYARSQAGSYHIELRTGICCAEDGDAATGINDLLDRANIALKAIKAYCMAQVDNLWEEVTRFENPHTYYVDLSQKLWDEKNRLLSERAT